MENSTPQATRIGFIGLGVMGSSMAGHLLAQGYPLAVFNRTRSKAEALIERGAVWKDSIAELAAEADVIISIVGFPKDVESIYFGAGGLIENAQSHALLIDMTTSSPELARRIAVAAAQRGVTSLDAPVSGGDVGAREARLSIMVGGEVSAFQRARPLFEALGKSIVLQGPAGSGQHTKLANQIAIAGTMLGVCEALAYAKSVGLDAGSVLGSISGGAAGSWTLTNLAPRMLAGDFAPGFFVKHFVKDLAIAEEMAAAQGLTLPGLSLGHARYRDLLQQGGENNGTQALFKLYVR